MMRGLIWLFVLLQSAHLSIILGADVAGVGLMKPNGGLDLQVDLQNVALKDGTTFSIKLRHLEDRDRRGVYSRFQVDYPGIYPDAASDRSSNRNDGVVLVGVAKFRNSVFYLPTDIERVEARDLGHGDIALRIGGLEHNYSNGDLCRLVDLQGNVYTVKRTGRYGLCIEGENGVLYACIKEGPEASFVGSNGSGACIVLAEDGTVRKVVRYDSGSVETSSFYYQDNGLLARIDRDGKHGRSFAWLVPTNRCPEFLRVAPAILTSDGESRYSIRFSVFGNELERARPDGTAETRFIPRDGF